MFIAIVAEMNKALSGRHNNWHWLRFISMSLLRSFIHWGVVNYKHFAPNGAVLSDTFG